MCGIAGVRHLDGRPTSAAGLEAMAATLVHRGPDAVGYWQGDGVGFAHTRLSIIDLPSSAQPMASPDGRWQLVFNGEIFNYRELREELGGALRTQGDTEVVLTGVARHGIGYVDRLRGQFAFVAHDTVDGTTYMVRDRLGVLPLFYSFAGGTLAFASEPKAIFAGTDLEPEVDHASLGAYLRGRSVPAPHTLFAGVHKLLPGHWARLDRDGTLTHHQYWSLPAPDPVRDWTPATAVDAVEQAVRAGVSSALVADVPVGAYLSGGVDSSLIAAVVSDLRHGGEVSTFSAGFGDPRYDELPWARRVSAELGTTHHEVEVRPDDFEGLWKTLTWHRDAPVSEPADIAVFRLAQLARTKVKVVLSGEGGDELFAGYPKYRMARALQATDVVPGALRAQAAALLERRIPGAGARARIALRAAGARTEAERFATWFAPFTTADRAALLQGTVEHPDHLLPGHQRDVIGRMLAADVRSWLPDNLLERGDRMSMAASLELRPPLLDHRLVELAFRLPSSVKMRGGTTKWALKEVARRYLPDEVVDRKKVGFRVPLDSWFRTGLRESVWDRLTGPESFVSQALDKDEVRALLERHESGRFNEESKIWTLMSLEVWHETFFRPTVVPTDHPDTITTAGTRSATRATSEALPPGTAADQQSS
ncbi:asparagine synthase (glutamine-hydrolyzing) [Actinotalea sp. BY-33]|uniref:asparagine synthase (glutamine-hydrolyzing) n=1 Tax=Actinotalea soli TaxID=2819234 RepID=A0A939LQ68_9CELL|nr:asparagine synthase (glutamine-hydrolyzing) [Actinotalea soli]MBO1751979.1 asparagine synthase (glutamine-hydrolyzing) [Actinotalea soli]